MDPVEAVEEILGSLSEPPPPGDLETEPPVMRVYVEDAGHAPPGAVTYREGPFYYYEESLAPDSIGDIYEPEAFVDVSVFEKADGGKWMPYRGPEGGEGWQNAETGEVRYQAEPPGEPMGPNELLDALAEAGEAPPGDELVALLDRAAEAAGVEPEETPEMPDQEAIEQLAELAEEYNADNVDLVVAAGDAIDREYPGLDPDEWSRVHEQVMLEIERPDPAPTEGDVVSVLDPDHGRVEGVVTYFERRDWGAYVDIDTGAGVVELELDNDQLERAHVLEEGAPVYAWTGEKHPDPVEVEPSDVAEALFSMGYDSEVENHFWARLRGVPENVEGEEAVERALRGALLEADEWEDDYRAVMKSAGREKRFADNSAPERLDPSRAEEVVDIMEVTDGSSTADSMDVAKMPDGSRVFVTHVSTDTPRGAFHERTSSARDAEVAVAASKALRAMGVDTPDHHYEHNRFLAVEDTGGYTANKARRFYEMEGDPDEDTYNPDYQQAVDALAAQILIGNRDPHPGNFSVVEEEAYSARDMGEVKRHRLVPFDLDLSGHNTTGWDEHNNPMRKAGRTLKKVTGDRASPAALAEEVEAAAQALADRIDLGDVLEAIPDREMREVVRRNVEARRT